MTSRKLIGTIGVGQGRVIIGDAIGLLRGSNRDALLDQELLFDGVKIIPVDTIGYRWGRIAVAAGVCTPGEKPVYVEYDDNGAVERMIIELQPEKEDLDVGLDDIVDTKKAVKAKVVCGSVDDLYEGII